MVAEERSGSGDIERTLQLLWRPDEAADRGPRRSLSVTAIVDAAVAMADRDGLGAVSMRALATELGVGAMTLYRYVPSKAELLDLMLDRVDRHGVDDLPADWRTAMEIITHEMWHRHRTHPWLPLVDRSRPVLGPNAVRSLDRAVGALSTTGLTSRAQIAVIVTIESFVVALARSTNALAARVARTGVTDAAFWSSQEETLIAAMQSGAFPHMAALDEHAFDASHADILEFGLRTILDGIEAHIADRDARTSGDR